MNRPRHISDSDLNAYVDGELDERTRMEVETWLAEHPEDALRVSAYRGQKEAMHGQFDPILDEPIPTSMVRSIQDSRYRALRSSGLQVAAAVLLLVLGALGGWGLRGLQIEGGGDPVDDFAERAVGAHRVYVTEVRHPVEVAAKQEAHLVAWLSKRLGHPLRAPDLTDAGYRLVGGRLLPDMGLPAAQFMYEDTAQRRLTVYLRPYEGKDIAFRFTEKEGASAFYWVASPFAFALSGEIPREELLKAAHAVYNEFLP